MFFFSNTLLRKQCFWPYLWVFPVFHVFWVAGNSCNSWDLKRLHSNVVSLLGLRPLPKPDHVCNVASGRDKPRWSRILNLLLEIMIMRECCKTAFSSLFWPEWGSFLQRWYFFSDISVFFVLSDGNIVRESSRESSGKVKLSIHFRDRTNETRICTCFAVTPGFLPPVRPPTGPECVRASPLVQLVPKCSPRSCPTRPRHSSGCPGRGTHTSRPPRHDWRLVSPRTVSTWTFTRPQKVSHLKKCPQTSVKVMAFVLQRILVGAPPSLLSWSLFMARASLGDRETCTTEEYWRHTEKWSSSLLTSGSAFLVTSSMKTNVHSLF